MFSFLWIVLGISVCWGYITYIEVRLPLQGLRSPPGSPWPQPRVWDQNDRVLTISPASFLMETDFDACDVLAKAVERYRGYILIDKDNGASSKILSTLPGVTVSVQDKSKCGYPTLDEDESYLIEVPKEGKAAIKAKSIWGALRGLETFSQLVYQNSANQYLINVTNIQDSPRYRYRGILLDSSRHFLPMKVLKQNLDAMAFNKFNVFHWHIVDDQSFPFESKVYPNISKLAAYSQKHVYTQDDVKEIVEYARLRGIRVVPEVDTPGHTQALGKAFPHLLTPCYDGDKKFAAVYEKYTTAEFLNPMLNATYDVVTNLVKEMKSVFKDQYIHLGMDEVYYACWKSSPEIKQFMEENNYTEIKEVEEHYVRRTLKNVKNTGYKYMIWQDPIDNGVVADNDTVVEVWKDNDLDKRLKHWQDYIVPIAKKGYKIVLSACWYLNYISYGMDWKKYYLCDPRNFTGTEEEKDLVIGGEACMWSEYVDGTNLLARLWPRASAVAERLWSPATLNDTDRASFRLDEHRCRMLRRGIPAQPVLNGYCGDYEWSMREKPNESLRLAPNFYIVLICVIFICLLVVPYDVIYKLEENYLP